MKKVFSIILLAATINTANAQTKAQKKLQANLNTIGDVTKMLQNEYEFVANTATVIPSTTFKMGECMVLTEYADEGINKQAKAVEKEMGANLNGSTWKFSGESNSTLGTVKVTSNGKTEEGGFATSGGMFKVTRIIDNFEIQAGVYQNKKDKNTYMIMFGVTQGMACFVDFVKQTGGGNEVGQTEINTTPATDAVKTAIPKTDDLKNKAKSKLLNKIKL